MRGNKRASASRPYDSTNAGLEGRYGSRSVGLEGLYLIIDPDQIAYSSPEAVAEAALGGGAQAVQWRQKSTSFETSWSSILRVRDLCRQCSVPFLINDRVDIALAVGADGVHLGHGDLPVSEARRLLVDKLVGASITQLDQIPEAVGQGASYLGVGPIFATASKGDAAPPLGLEFLVQARQLTQLPIVAIGGINAQNAAEVMAAGGDAIAVLSAICGADQPGRAATELVNAIRGATVS